MPGNFTTAEVAEIAEVSMSLVNKAVEEKVIKPIRRRRRKRVIRLLPAHAVAYTAVMSKVRAQFGRDARKRFAARLEGMMAADAIAAGKIEVETGVEVDVGKLAGEAMSRAESYLDARERHIVEDETIKGGTPVIRGTRMTVYSVLGRVKGGDSLDDIAAENPHIPLEALKAACVYAKTHPLLGRPAGKPWRP
jgi:uncharacterized protein (DUF433 family)